MTQISELKSKEDRREAATPSEIEGSGLTKDCAALRAGAVRRSEALLSTATPQAIRNIANSYGNGNPPITKSDHGIASRCQTMLGVKIDAERAVKRGLITNLLNGTAQAWPANLTASPIFSRSHPKDISTWRTSAKLGGALPAVADSLAATIRCDRFNDRIRAGMDSRDPIFSDRRP